MGRWSAGVFGVYLASIGACAPEPLPPDPGDNLILVTLDGVRAREMFGVPDPGRMPGDTAPVFPRLMEARWRRDAWMYGDPRHLDESMTTGNNTQRSLPGYMGIFTGYEQPCYDNDCPRVRVETVLEYVQRRREYPFGEVAVFASWDKLTRALEVIPGTLFTDAGPTPELTDLPPWQAARWDQDTFAAAMAYLETRRPRLLYIALVDGDAWAHMQRYPSYVAALRQYDVWIDELQQRLAGMGEYGARTTVMVFNDHGRGDGDGWFEHDTERPGSERTFVYATGPHVTRPGLPADHHFHGDIRPTIETVFGVPATTCVRCGAPMLEVVGDGAIGALLDEPERLPATAELPDPEQPDAGGETDASEGP